MALQSVPGYIGIPGYNHPATLMRNFNAGVAGRRAGAFRYNDFALTPSAVNMTCLINSGEAMVLGNEDSAQGGYYAWSNLPETIAWPAAGGTPRYDTLLLRVVDTTYGSDAGLGSFWEVVSGTPSGSPVPVTDADLNVGGPLNRHGAYLRIADFLVGASITNLAAATLVHRRKYARLGRHTMGLVVDLPADAQVGDSYTYLDGTNTTGDTVRYNGTDWEAGSVERWRTWTPTVRNNGISGTPATISSTVDYARYKKVGDQVFYHFALTINAAAANGMSISLPISSPTIRTHHAGHMFIFGTGAPTDQTGVAYMGGGPAAPWDRIYGVNINTGLKDGASGNVVRASGSYYVDM
jgi:hypothetical protein